MVQKPNQEEAHSTTRFRQLRVTGDTVLTKPGDMQEGEVWARSALSVGPWVSKAVKETR